jgi:hypothetical protein
MVIIPRDKPVFENLNIYYLDVKKLLEHYQGEIGTGGIYFKSHSAEGVLFFDKDDILSGHLKEKNIEFSGSEAVERLLSAGDTYNFTVNVYQIAEEEVYFWASIPTAEKIYKDLSTEFTDLEGLIKKMISEKLTGYIEVSIGNGDETGLIFIINGRIMGGSYSWENGEPIRNKENQKLLISKTKANGGAFNVCRIPLNNMKIESQADAPAESASGNTLDMLEELLVTFENIVLSRKRIRTDFNKMLKQKFVEKADNYAFLDPFAGEFDYSDRKISFAGDASDNDLVSGVLDSVKEMARELGLLPLLVADLGPWIEKYTQELDQLGIDI